MQFVHPEYGIFVRLDDEVKVAVGDVLEAVRDGAVVATLTVQKITRPEPVYPHGAAVCRAPGPGVVEGLGVRRAKR